MTMPKTALRLKEFHQNFGWVINWVVLIAVGYLIAFGDQRYARPEHVHELRDIIATQRKEDMRVLDTRIVALQAREDINRDAIAELRMLTARLTAIAERLEAQVGRED